MSSPGAEAHLPFVDDVAGLKPGASTEP